MSIFECLDLELERMVLLLKLISDKAWLYSWEFEKEGENDFKIKYQ